MKGAGLVNDKNRVHIICSKCKGKDFTIFLHDDERTLSAKCLQCDYDIDLSGVIDSGCGGGCACNPTTNPLFAGAQTLLSALGMIYQSYAEEVGEKGDEVSRARYSKKYQHIYYIAGRHYKTPFDMAAALFKMVEGREFNTRLLNNHYFRM